MSVWMVRIRQSAVLAVVVALLFFANVVASTRRQLPFNQIANPHLEEPVETGKLPTDWSFETTSGTYQCEVTASTPSENVAHSGMASVSFGGTAGAAELRTNSFALAGNCVAECDAWVKTEMVRGGVASVFVRFPDTDPATFPPIVFGLNPRATDWQRAHFFCAAPSPDIDEQWPMLAIHLKGEALVRVDNVSVKVDPFLFPTQLIQDNGFESPDSEGVYSDWTHSSAESTGTAEKLVESPQSGTACVRLAGTGEWGVLVSNPTLSSRNSRVVLQAFVRVTEGGGAVQLDYQRNGEKFASSISSKVEKSDDWSLVSVESEAALMSRATSVALVMTAFGGEGSYIVDFDAVELFVRK